MAPVREPTPRGWIKTLLSPYPWVIAVLLLVITLLHYLTPQTRLLPAPANASLARHAVERFLFLLPVIVATFAYRWQGGVLTLALAVLSMLPRAIWITPFSADALVETTAAAVTGGLAIWAIEAQARQKTLQEQAATRLGALNAVAEQITSEIELSRILPTVLEIAGDLVGADGGGIALFDPSWTNIHYPYLHNLPDELAGLSIARGTGLAGQVMTTGRPAVVGDYRTYPGALPDFVRAGLVSVISVPIVSGDHVFGALTLASIHGNKRFSETDVAILTSVGRQAGIAIENARLYERMRFYARQVMWAQEAERGRIARELHDEMLQLLIVISRRLELLAALPERLPQPEQQVLTSAQELLHNAQQGLRRFAQGLRPPTLEHLGLVSALRGLANELAETEGIESKFSLVGEAKRLASEEELTLFRIAQEGLNNVRRHAGASQVDVRIEFDTDCVRLTIADNGRGFDVSGRTEGPASPDGLGLIGMNERAQSLGGTLRIESEPGMGTTVHVEVPV